MNYIFIYDDNKIILETYKNIINNYITMHNQFKLGCVSSNINNVISDIEKIKLTDPNFNGIYFLDIHFPNSNHSGIYYAKKIRSINPTSKIIFISSHMELTYITLEQHIEPFDFIIKDHGIEHIRDRIFHNLDNITLSLDKITNDNNKLIIKDEGMRYIINLSDVLYIETSKLHPHKLIIHLIDKSEFEFYGKLNNIVLENENLIRIHRSFCVNVKYVTTCDYPNKEITLNSELKLPIGRKYKINLNI